MSPTREPISTSNVNTRVGERLKTMRLARGLKQVELAAGLGVTFQQIHKYETARAPLSLERLVRAAEFLQVPLDFFLRPAAAEGALLEPANRLRELRLQSGLSLQKLGKAAGTSGQYTRVLENGTSQLTVGWLIKYAAVLGCHPWSIVDPRGGDDGAGDSALRQLRSLTPEQGRPLTQAARQSILEDHAGAGRVKGTIARAPLESLANEPPQSSAQVSAGDAP